MESIIKLGADPKLYDKGVLVDLLADSSWNVVQVSMLAMSHLTVSTPQQSEFLSY